MSHRTLLRLPGTDSLERRCRFCGSEIQAEDASCTTTFCTLYSQPTTIQDGEDLLAPSPAIIVHLPTIFRPTDTVSWDATLLSLDTASIHDYIARHEVYLVRRLDNSEEDRRTHRRAAKAWFEDIGPHILHANSRANAGVVRSKTVLPRRYDYEVQRKLEPATEPWIHVVRCDALEAAKMLHKQQSHRSNQSPSICVLNYRDCLPGEYPSDMRCSLDNKSLCLRTTLWWSLMNASRRVRRENGETASSLTYEHITASPDVLAVRMDQTKYDLESRMTEETEQFYINVVTVNRDEELLDESRGPAAEDYMASQLEAAMNLALSMGTEYMVLRPWELSGMDDRSSAFQAATIGRLLRRTWKSSWNSITEETWQTRGFKRVIIAVDDSDYDPDVPIQPQREFDWEFRHCPTAFLDPENRTLALGAGTGLPYSGLRRSVYDYPRPGSLLPQGPQDGDITLIRRRYLAMILNLDPELGHHSLLPRVRTDNPVEVLSHSNTRSHIRQRVAQVVHGMLSELNVDYLSDVFVPLRRLYLRHAYKQVEGPFVEPFVDRPVTADDREQLLNSRFAKWITYCNFFEGAFIWLYSKLHEVLLEVPTRFEEILRDTDVAGTALFNNDVNVWLARHLESEVEEILDTYRGQKYGTEPLQEHFEREFPYYNLGFDTLLSRYQPDWVPYRDNCRQGIPRMPVLPRLPIRDVWLEVSLSRVPFEIEVDLTQTLPY